MENQKRFLEKYRDFPPYIDDGRWVVDKKRRIRDVGDVIPKILEEGKGFGRNLREAGKFEVLYDADVLKIGDEFLRFMDKFV